MAPRLVALSGIMAGRGDGEGARRCVGPVGVAGWFFASKANVLLLHTGARTPATAVGDSRTTGAKTEPRAHPTPFLPSTPTPSLAAGLSSPRSAERAGCLGWLLGLGGDRAGPCSCGWGCRAGCERGGVRWAAYPYGVSVASRQFPPCSQKKIWKIFFLISSVSGHVLLELVDVPRAAFLAPVVFQGVRHASHAVLDPIRPLPPWC